MPSQTLPQLMEQVDRLERQVLKLSQQAGIPFDTGLTYASDREAAGGGAVPAEVETLAREGKKIEAIKELRAATGMGLAEAKDAVDGIDGV